jgi:hypothetical protein
MILNSPTKTEFEKISIENLTQAFNLLFKVYENYMLYDDEVVKEDVSIENIWEHHNGTIRTSLILLHQAIEGLMKATICETSPLLLIDKPKKDWPTLPESEDKDFDSLYTIGGEALLSTFCAVKSSINVDTNIISFIEDIRQKRNKAIHGTNVKDVTPKYIVESILQTFTIWFGKDIWHRELIENIIANPLFGYFDSDYESAVSYKFLDFCLFLLGESNLSKHISIDIKGRKYFCPLCKQNIESEYDHLESKWAFLNPNLPESTNVSCINCHQTIVVKREKCNKDDCKGNVLYDAEFYGGLICLTCCVVHEYDEE